MVGLVKLVTLSITGRRVQAQRTRSEPNSDNPLGRVLQAYQQNKTLDPEALELRLDQAVIEEADRLDHYMWLVRVVSVVAPLMGLLGTVTGMIEVFEVMAISGSGNPRSMASGVAKATVPTMAGMVAALSGVAMGTYITRTAQRERELLADELILEH